MLKNHCYYIINYTLNNFTSLYDNFIVDHDNIIEDFGKNNNFKNKKRIILLGKKTHFVNVETDPRLG